MTFVVPSMAWRRLDSCEPFKFPPSCSPLSKLSRIWMNALVSSSLTLPEVITGTLGRFPGTSSTPLKESCLSEKEKETQTQSQTATLSTTSAHVRLNRAFLGPADVHSETAVPSAMSWTHIAKSVFASC